MSLPMYQADAFTEEPFSGNPAAVCLVSRDVTLSDDVMAKIAAEMNLSETAFVTEKDSPFALGSHFGLRWFTPTCEVNLCGHATLASAAVLFQALGNRSEALSFDTASGVLTARREADGFIGLDLPLNPPVEEADPSAATMAVANHAACGLSWTSLHYSAATKKLVVRLRDNVSRAQLEAIAPDTNGLMSLDRSGRIRGVMVTLLSDGAGGSGCYDFISRYFAPWNGIPEDPVTGSAHTVLAPYYAKELDRTQLVSRQCSPRGGDLRLTVGATRLGVAGRACVVLEGTFRYRRVPTPPSAPFATTTAGDNNTGPDRQERESGGGGSGGGGGSAFPNLKLPQDLKRFMDEQSRRRHKRRRFTTDSDPASRYLQTLRMAAFTSLGEHVPVPVERKGKERVSQWCELCSSSEKKKRFGSKSRKCCSICRVNLCTRQKGAGASDRRSCFDIWHQDPTFLAPAFYRSDNAPAAEEVPPSSSLLPPPAPSQ